MTKPDQCGMVTQMIRMMRITRDCLCQIGHLRLQCRLVIPMMRKVMLMLMIIEVDNNDKLSLNDGSYDSIKMVAGRKDMGDMNKYIIER